MDILSNYDNIPTHGQQKNDTMKYEPCFMGKIPSPKILKLVAPLI